MSEINVANGFEEAAQFLADWVTAGGSWAENRLEQLRANVTTKSGFRHCLLGAQHEAVTSGATEAVCETWFQHLTELDDQEAADARYKMLMRIYKLVAGQEVFQPGYGVDEL